jgi:segregation and condensation protein B
MEASEKRRIVEALILSSSEPISAVKLAEIIPYCKPGHAKDLVNELNTEYAEQDRAFEIWEVAGGYQLRTRAEFSGYLQKLQKERALRLSQAALETLAIIAYRQPVTRAEIEDVRGVDAGAVVKTLLERHLIRIAGQREVPGRPMLYGTSRRFLEVFGLDDLKGLPTLRELDELAREQGLLETEEIELSEIAEGEASQTEAEPSAIGGEPSAIDGEPSATEQEPSATEQEPSAIDGEPSATDQEPSGIASETPPEADMLVAGDEIVADDDSVRLAEESEVDLDHTSPGPESAEDDASTPESHAPR